MIEKLLLRNIFKIMLFDGCNLDFDPMTFALKHDLDITVNY